MPRRRPTLPRPLALIALAGVVTVLTLTHLGAASAATANVAMGDNTFTPGAVTITAGDTVVWTDNGVRPHTVTADDNSFDSGNMSTGQTFNRTFETPGTFRYFCKIHGAAGGIGMSGTIVVQAAQATTTTAAPTTTTLATATTAASSTATTTATTAATTQPTAVLSAPAERSAVAAAPPVALATTGSYSAAMAAIGLALVLTGAVVVWRMRLLSPSEAAAGRDSPGP